MIDTVKTDMTKGGDIPRPNGQGYYRKVIRIRAEDSPNVKLGLLQERQGKVPTNELLIPGVKSYAKYKKHRELWDRIKQCIGLDAQFYKGAELLMFPPTWLNRAETRAYEIAGTRRVAESIGCDPGEGGDDTCWSVIDKLGLIDLITMSTPDTSVITSFTLGLMRQHNVDPENIVFDQGGGGQEHADRLRLQGYDVRTVAFGEAASSIEMYKRMRTDEEKIDEKENKYVYKNRRAEMYGILRQLLDPNNPEQPQGFALPVEYAELRRQLAPIPLWYDEEGRLYLPPKKLKPDAVDATRRKTMTELIGCSPDEADSLVLAVFGMMVKANQFVVR